MIGTIDIRVNAAHPNLALAEVCGFVGSPSSVRIANVPERIGTWSLTSVRLIVSYPDNVETERSCVRVNGVWTGTIPAPERAGSVVGGFKVLADGTDENGEPVTGYVLGVGDVRVLNRDNTEGDTSHLFHLKDETPDDPKKADVVHLSGDWKIYDGEGWIPFGAQPVTDYNELENRPQINGVTLSGDKSADDLGLAAKTDLSGFLPLGEGGTIQGIPLQISQSGQKLRISDGGAGHYAGTVTIWPDGIEIYGPEGLVADCV